MGIWEHLINIYGFGFLLASCQQCVVLCYFKKKIEWLGGRLSLQVAVVGESLHSLKFEPLSMPFFFYCMNFISLSSFLKSR